MRLKANLLLDQGRLGFCCFGIERQRETKIVRGGVCITSVHLRRVDVRKYYAYSGDTPYVSIFIRLLSIDTYSVKEEE